MLDPQSSGELDDAGTSNGTSATHGDVDGDVSGPATPPSPCGDEACTAPVEPRWSSTFGFEPFTWACDVAIDPTGRVALAWHVDSATDDHPLGWTGIQLYGENGNLLDSVDVDGQIYGALAFASDGTLRVRGATAQGGGLFQEWARALDPNLQPTWTVPYNEQNGGSQCGWGSRGIEVGSADQITTYEHGFTNGSGSRSLVRRHAANGTELWTKDVGGNPAFSQAPIALGSDQSTFHGATKSYDDYDEVEIRKLDPNGDELWMTVIPGELDGIWGTADGGVIAASRDFYGNREREVFRLDASGSSVWDAGPVDPSIYRVAAPTADETGLFMVAQDGLRRTALDLASEWTAPIEHGSPGWGVMASAVRNDTLFAFAGTLDDDTGSVFVSVLAVP